jgi:hypothetical protein
MSCQQITGQNHYIKVVDKFFEIAAKLKYSGVMVKNQNCIHKEIKSRLNLGMLAIMQFRIFCLPVCYIKT